MSPFRDSLSSEPCRFSVCSLQWYASSASLFFPSYALFIKQNSCSDEVIHLFTPKFHSSLERRTKQPRGKKSNYWLLAAEKEGGSQSKARGYPLTNMHGTGRGAYLSRKVFPVVGDEQLMRTSQTRLLQASRSHHVSIILSRSPFTDVHKTFHENKKIRHERLYFKCQSFLFLRCLLDCEKRSS